MAETGSKTSLRAERSAGNLKEKQDDLMKQINEDYADAGKYYVTPTNQRNIMLIGRTRSGKSTIKSLLVNPTIIPDELSLKSGTRDPQFESFHVQDNQMVLNIIDTPGLFERGTSRIDIRDNETILRTIKICVNNEITKFHVIGFCVAITAGINQEDIESVKLLASFLGKEVSRNSCLIITRCESKNNEQQSKLKSEILEDIAFKEIAQFFELGIFFSGSLNRDDYNKGSESLYEQFFSISDYRTKLIDMFTKSNKEFPINETLLSEVRKCKDEDERKDVELDELQDQADRQARLIEELEMARINDKWSIKRIIDQLIATTINEHTRLNDPKQTINPCVIL